MKVDAYTRAVLTVIAIALLYLCAAFTPVPSVHAQRAARPGDDTGPAQCVIVGWKATDHVPVQVLDSITLKTTGDVRVTGTVQTEQKANSLERVVLTGWEEAAGEFARGGFRPIGRDAKNPNPRALPVTISDPQ
jgi:hypothetical protein